MTNLNGEKLMEYIGGIDDELILEAEDENFKHHTMQIKHGLRGIFANRTRYGFAKVASVAVVLISVSIIAINALFFAPNAPLSSSNTLYHDWETDAPASQAIPEQQPAAGGTAPMATPPSLDSPAMAWGTLPAESADGDWVSDYGELPMLYLGRGFALGDGFGMQAFSVTDARQIIGNPPNILEMNLETLPVFLNPTLQSLPMQTTPDINFIMAEIGRIANTNILGLSMQDAFVTVAIFRPYEFDGIGIESATARWGNIRIEIPNTDLPHSLIIQLPTEAFPSISGNIFEHGYVGSLSDEQALLLTEKLLEHFADIIGMTNPVPDITSAYVPPRYDESARIFLAASLSAYESYGDYVAQILGYNFHRVNFRSAFDSRFTADDGRELGRLLPPSIEIIRPDFKTSLPIGNYPILSVQEATELLTQVHYVSAEAITHVDIVYITHLQEIFMPFYRFVVKHSADDFGVYFIPAVRPEFLVFND